MKRYTCANAHIHNFIIAHEKISTYIYINEIHIYTALFAVLFNRKCILSLFTDIFLYLSSKSSQFRVMHTNKRILEPGEK